MATTGLVRWALFDEETPTPVVLPDGADRIAELTDTELADLEEALLALFDETVEARPDDVVRILSVVADTVDAVRLEAAGRLEAQAAADTAIVELTGRVHTVEATADGDESADGDDSADAETSGQEVTSGEPAAETADEPEPVAAAVPPRVPVTALALRRPPARPPVDPVDTMAVTRDLVARARGWRSGPDGMQVVTRVTADYPPERRLSLDSDPTVVRRALDAVVAPDAVVAAGGLCQPVAGYYERIGLASSARPVRSALPSFQATRGGIRFNEAWEVADFSDATGVWPESLDADPGESTKELLVVDCPDEVEVRVAAVTKRVRYGNFLARFNPELTQDVASHTTAAHARRGDSQLLDRVKALSVQVTQGQALGAARDLLYGVRVAAAGLRSRLRIPRGVSMRVLMPDWALDLMAADVLRALNADLDQYQVGVAEVEGYLRAAGVAPAWYVDTPTTGVSQQFAAPTAGGLLDYPDVVQWGLWPEGTFVHLDGGELDLGVVRDSTLNSVNDLETFGETFENVAKVGHTALWVTSAVCASGASSAGTEDIHDLCGGPFVPGS